MTADQEVVLSMIREDSWMIEVLRLVRDQALPDWWIGAGFVRSKVWDVLHGYSDRTPLPDVDVIYYDPSRLDEENEKLTEHSLASEMGGIKWSVKNQARMHLNNHNPAYKSSTDALAYWVETATCVGVRLDARDNLTLAAPYGIDDLLGLVIRPSPPFFVHLDVFRARVAKKKWQDTWPKLVLKEN